MLCNHMDPLNKGLGQKLSNIYRYTLHKVESMLLYVTISLGASRHIIGSVFL
jgi:hypothetical protein